MKHFFAVACLLTLALSTIGAAACRAQTTNAELAAKVQRFDKYPLVWLGDSYDVDGDGDAEPLVDASEGYSPALYHPKTGALIKPELHWFSIAYGTCEIPKGSSACPVPLALTIREPCWPIPLSGFFRAGNTNVRGIEADISSDGGVYIATADFTLIVNSTGNDSDEVLKNAMRAVNDLVGGNAKANSISKTSHFRPKTSDTCPSNLDLPTPPAATPVAPTASLRLDLDPTTPGIQPSLAIDGAQDIAIDVVLGDNVGNVSSFNFTLIYDDSLLTPAGENGGGLKGNPDFNDEALGTSWNCSPAPAPSPSPDVDPVTGAGHGVALLSCVAHADGTLVTAPVVVATLHLHASAAVRASIELVGVLFLHGDGTEIGGCNSIRFVAMTCVGGSLVAQ